VLSSGPTPHTPLQVWSFALEAEDGTQIMSRKWDEFRALGPTEITVDIHCVTHWSKFDSDWRGISVDRIFAAAGFEDPPSPFVTAFCDGGYTTNLPVEDLRDERGWSSGSTTVSRSRPSTGDQRASWCRTSISGSPRSGYEDCASWTTTSQGSGR
jgi:Oxidoreductase molybdopterin binding domain